MFAIIHIHVQIQMESHGCPKALVEAYIITKFYFCWNSASAKQLLTDGEVETSQTILIQFNAAPKRIELQKRA